MNFDLKNPKTTEMLIHFDLKNHNFDLRNPQKTQIWINSDLKPIFWLILTLQSKILMLFDPINSKSSNSLIRFYLITNI